MKSWSRFYACGGLAVCAHLPVAVSLSPQARERFVKTPESCPPRASGHGRPEPVKLLCGTSPPAALRPIKPASRSAEDRQETTPSIAWPDAAALEWRVAAETV